MQQGGDREARGENALVIGEWEEDGCWRGAEKGGGPFTAQVPALQTQVRPNIVWPKEVHLCVFFVLVQAERMHTHEPIGCLFDVTQDNTRDPLSVCVYLCSAVA